MYASDSSSYEFEVESKSTLSSSLDSIESLEENNSSFSDNSISENNLLTYQDTESLEENNSFFPDNSISENNLLTYQDTENPDKVLLNQLADLFNNAYRRFEEELQELQGLELSNKRFGVVVAFIDDLEHRLLYYLP